MKFSAIIVLAFTLFFPYLGHAGSLPPGECSGSLNAGAKSEGSEYTEEFKSWLGQVMTRYRLTSPDFQAEYRTFFWGLIAYASVNETNGTSTSELCWLEPMRQLTDRIDLNPEEDLLAQMIRKHCPNLVKNQGRRVRFLR